MNKLFSNETWDFFRDFKHNVQDEVTTFAEGASASEWLLLIFAAFFAGSILGFLLGVVA